MSDLLVDNLVLMYQRWNQMAGDPAIPLGFRQGVDACKRDLETVIDWEQVRANRDNRCTGLES